jgi:hypothetical protein
VAVSERSSCGGEPRRGSRAAQRVDNDGERLRQVSVHVGEKVVRLIGHARFLPARTSIQASCDRWSKFFSNTAVNQLTPDKIHEFIVWLDNCGYSSAVVRTLTVGIWAFRRAARSDVACMVAAIAQQE